MKKLFYITFSMLLCTAVISCKKEKTDDSVEGRFQGTWLERSGKKITLVVSKNPGSDANTPNLFLNVGTTGYPFVYKFNSAGDTIFLSDKTSSDISDQDVPYKITFSQNAFTIKKFHPSLPDSEEITFDKIKQ